MEFCAGGKGLGRRKVAPGKKAWAWGTLPGKRLGRGDTSKEKAWAWGHYGDTARVKSLAWTGGLLLVIGSCVGGGGGGGRGEESSHLIGALFQKCVTQSDVISGPDGCVRTSAAGWLGMPSGGCCLLPSAILSRPHNFFLIRKKKEKKIVINSFQFIEKRIELFSY